MKKKMKNKFKNKAGCIVTKENNQTEVLLIYRKDYDDWTFPKGHVEQGETLPEAAARETKEETGYSVDIQKKIDNIIYQHQRDGTTFTCDTHYYLAKPQSHSEGAVPNEEVDKIQWLTLPEAKQKLTYENNKELLKSIKE
jgi:8-oxo-dGTP diphosphatase